MSHITGQSPQVPKSHVSLSDLTRALSGERLEAYSSERDDRDSTDAAARYLWNGAMVGLVTPDTGKQLSTIAYFPSRLADAGQ